MVADPRQFFASMSVEEYQTLSRNTPDARYEYADGVVTLMSGGTSEHADIAGNIYVEFHAQFQSGPCHVYNSDMRVQVSETRYYFPDITITCDVADRQRGVDMVQSPRVVVEVLSPSTIAKDRGEKFIAYQSCLSIQEYVLVSTHTPCVEVYRRGDKNGAKWTYQRYGQEEVVMLESVDVCLPMPVIYHNIKLEL